MKRIYYLSALPALLLAACTQSEEFVTQQSDQTKTMKFDVAFVGKNSRATGNLTTANLGNQKLIFWCDAYSGSTTPETTTTGLWISTQEPLYLNKQSAPSNYWDVFSDASTSNGAEVQYPGSSYTTYYTAIAPQAEFEEKSESATKATYSMAGQYTDGNTAPTFGNRELTLGNIPVVQEVVDGETPKGVDYLIACATSTTEEVSLHFNHLLSRLKFAVWTDENTMKTPGSETTKIELNEIVFYLPGTDAKAQYIQTNHNGKDGTWSWTSFTSTTTSPTESSLNGYQAVKLITSGIKEVKYYSGPSAAHDAAWDDVKLTNEDKTFFIAPNGNTECKLYMDITYTVKRKLTDGNWSSSSNEGEGGYHGGHKVVTRTGMAVPVNDGTHSDSSNNNEGLSHFHQGVNEILYICLRADQKVTFSTEFNVNSWVEDPIDASKNQ